MTFFAALALAVTTLVAPVATTNVERVATSTEFTVTYTVSGSAGLTA